MAKTATKKRAPIPVDITNVGGIREAHLEIQPGAINVLVGLNGEGKSTSLACIRRATGERVPLEVRDGAHVGTVEMPGVKLQVKGSIRATGQAEVTLADTGPLTRLIDPGLKGDDEKATARVRALLELIRPAFTADVVAQLADEEPGVTAAVEQELAEGGPRDLVDVAERVRLTAHQQARAAEAAAQVAAGKATAAELNAKAALEKAGGEGALVDISVQEAERQEKAASENLGATRAAHERRLALERQKQEIGATLGVAPDPDRLDTDIELREQMLTAADARIRELEQQIAQIRETSAATRSDRDALVAQRNREREALRRHQQQAALLAQSVEGPTDEELQAIEAAAARAQELRRAAVVSAEVRQLSTTALAAREEFERIGERAARLRDVAKSVYDRLAMLPGIAEKAYPLTIVAGRVHVVDGEQLHDFESRRSAGQKVAAAFAVAAKCYAEASDELAPIVALDGHLWADLDPEAKAEAARAAAELGLAVLTEQPTDGPLAVVQMQGFQGPSIEVTQ